MGRWKANRSQPWVDDDPDLYDDEDGAIYIYHQPHGTLDPGEDDSQPSAPAAGLWLPNPEMRRGWEFYRIERAEQRESPQAKPVKQAIGFKVRRNAQ